MKNVILYTRVSTDEQAEGCSLEVQEEFLRAYCSNHDYHIVGEVYKEDFSAKDHSLKRPEMKRLFEYCKKHRHEVDMVLFLRWDRFSRNVEFAFAYKRKFVDELGIEINTVESPIDFNSGDWATLLALYCGTAHSEDIKIAKRTKDGIHGHLEKGQWTCRAPLGYKNVRRDKHDCWVEIDETTAPRVREAFEEVAKGVEAPYSIKKRLFPKMIASTFFRMLRNKFYIGIVHVPTYNGTKEHDVKGQHEALIDKQTFQTVQDILDGKKKRNKVTSTFQPDLYLRKFLCCPECGHLLTGATSKGGSGKHYNYYFCNHDHKHLNVRSEIVHKGFEDYMAALEPNQAVLKLYTEILFDARGERVGDNNKQADKLQVELDDIKNRMNRMNDLYFDGEISKTEKVEATERFTRRCEVLQGQIKALRLSDDMKIKDKLSYSTTILGNLGEFFETGSPEVKVKLISSIFPEKIEYDGKNYRTGKYNQVLDLIYQNASELQEMKKGRSPKNDGNLPDVPPRRIERLSSEPESEILSIELRRHLASANIVYF